MITVSDNYAALTLVQRIGSKNISDFLVRNNFSDSEFSSPPLTSARDISNFYETLYKGKFINKAASKEMMEILKKQEINDRIPKYLPGGVVTAHKTGELFGYKHDAGIIFSKRGDLIIVVLTNTIDPTAAAENIAVFSRDIYSFIDGR